MRHIRWLIACCLCLLATAGWAGSAIGVSACTTGRIPLAASAQMVADRTGAWTPAVVAALPGKRLQPVVSGERLYRASRDWWLRVDLDNDTDKPCQRWLQVGPARLRNIHVYVRQGDGWKAMRGGTDYPFRQWALPARQPVFPVMLPAHGTSRVLVRLAGRGGVMSFAPVLWQPERFQSKATHHALVDGLKYGVVALLTLVGLLLGYLYRRRALCFMAVAVGTYVAYLAAQNNYLFVYLWPSSPALNVWVRYFLSGAFFIGLYGYLYVIARVRLLGKWWQRASMGVFGMFLLVALLGGLVDALGRVSMVMFALDQLCRWALAVALVVAWHRRTQRHVYPILLVGFLCLQSVQIYGRLLGLSIPSPAGEHVYVSTFAIASMLLLATLINQVRLGRRAELNAQAALARQRASENERLEATVMQRTDALRRALQSRRLLLGRISHDLRAPLAGMLDSARLWRSGDSRRDYPQLIERHARRQMDMIDELLEFSRAELVDLEMQPVPGYLHAFLVDVAEQMELAADHRGNHIELAFAAHLPALVCLDFHHLRQVLVNLLGNANQFAAYGHIRFAVDALSNEDGRGVRLHFIVDDDGEGMVPAERERLLQPFARGSNASGVQGHGLGLAIVTRLLECMGSRLTMNEAPGGGSRFHFVLDAPLAAESDMDPVLDDDGTVPDDGAGRVVLVVDDDAQQRELTCDLLDGYGFDSVMAVSGQAALAVMRERRVDLVLTDQCMHDGDGWDLLQAVTAERPGLPVVLYSALPPRRPDHIDAAAVFAGVLLKPADAPTLLRQVVLATHVVPVVESVATRESSVQTRNV